MAYGDYQLGLTDAQVDAALTLVHNMEQGTVAISSDGSKSIISKTVQLTSPHTNVPKVMLQIRTSGQGYPTSCFKLCAHVTAVSKTSFDFAVVNSSDTQHPKDTKIPIINFYVDYLVIG